MRFLWLDIINVLGSVPHNHIRRMLLTSGVTSNFLCVCKEIYFGSFQRNCSRDGFTNDIPLCVGIKQGCPMSSLLFNFALEGIIPHLASLGHGYKLSSGAMDTSLAVGPWIQA